MARREAWGRSCAGVALAMAAALMTGCVSLPDEGFAPAPQAATPRFDAIAFFTGRSTGRGQLSKIMGGTVPVEVTSEGTLARDGTLTLEQRVKEGEKEPRTRTWILRETVPGRYIGSLTDAIGPVTGTTQGNRLTLRYVMKDGFKVEQVLTLSPDGARADNLLTVKMLGAKVAVLTEEIVRGE